MDDKLMGLLVDEESTHGHCCLQLESLIVRGIDGEGDGIVLNTGLSLFAQPGALRNQFDKLAGNGNLALGLLAETDAYSVADTLGE